MAIEQVSEDINKKIQAQREKEKNTIKGCHIKVEGDRCIISIPSNDDIKYYEFPKREFKELLERLYTS